MAINFASINLEVIDLNINTQPDIYVNTHGITVSKRVLEDMNYPQSVQYCTDPSQHIFAIRACKGNENRAVPFSKGKADQTGTLSINSRNLHDVLTALIPDYAERTRYKVTGQYDTENRTMYFDMAAAEISEFRNNKE